MKKIILKQEYKGLEDAKFTILTDDKEVGKIEVKGNIYSPKVDAYGYYLDQKFQLHFETLGTTKKHRQYTIIEDDETKGEIYHTIFRKNIFISYEYIKCLYKEHEYTSYDIGLGMKNVYPVYKEDKEIAQIEKDGKVYNDLHEFIIYCLEDELLTVINAIYIYLGSYFITGQKVTKSYAKNYYKTTSKLLLSKYNPNWLEENN